MSRPVALALALLGGAGCAGAGSQAAPAVGSPGAEAEEQTEMSSYQRAVDAAPEGAAVVAVEGFSPNGYELFWIDTSRPHDDDSGYGVAVGEGGVLTGQDAFRAASPGLSPAELAQLSMVLLGEGGEPLPGPSTDAHRAAGVSPPAVDGRTLSWWSEYRMISAPGLRRHTLDLDSLSLETAAAEALSSQAIEEQIAQQAELLGNPSSFARDGAVRALAGLCSEPRAVEALVDALGDGQYPATRAAIAKALAGCAGSAGALLEALSDEDYRVRAAAATSLGAQAAAGMLGEVSVDTVRAALEALRDGDPHADPRGAARRALAALP